MLADLERLETRFAEVNDGDDFEFGIKITPSGLTKYQKLKKALFTDWQQKGIPVKRLDEINRRSYKRRQKLLRESKDPGKFILGMGELNLKRTRYSPKKKVIRFE